MSPGEPGAGDGDGAAGAAGLRRLHHLGVTVADVGRSAAFWSAFLGVEPRWRRVLDGEYLGGITGYRGIHLDAAVIDLPGGDGAVLEILEYLIPDKHPNPPDTANPGNVHICLAVDDIGAMRERALACGAVPVSPGPVEVTVGPNAGARACYLRDPDGITLELLQPPPGAVAG